MRPTCWKKTKRIIMTFEEYCQSKKIDAKAFATGDPKKWMELKELFEQVHPNSFTQQKKFLINNIRRTYLLKESVSPLKEEPKKISPKPVIKKINPVAKPNSGSPTPKIPKPAIPKRP